MVIKIVLGITDKTLFMRKPSTATIILVMVIRRDLVLVEGLLIMSEN
jgi:hypothetical protein